MMPIIFSGDTIKDGDTVKVGEKVFALEADGTLKMEVAVPIQKRYSLPALLQKKATLEAELAEVNALITKHAELSP